MRNDADSQEQSYQDTLSITTSPMPRRTYYSLALLKKWFLFSSMVV